jgi:hypothetical protein
LCSPLNNWRPVEKITTLWASPELFPELASLQSRALRNAPRCQSCLEIDKRVEQHLKLLRLTTDPAEIERTERLISELYADRVRLHQNQEQ